MDESDYWSVMLKSKAGASHKKGHVRESTVLSDALQGLAAAEAARKISPRPSPKQSQSNVGKEAVPLNPSLMHPLSSLVRTSSAMSSPGAQHATTYNTTNVSIAAGDLDLPLLPVSINGGSTTSSISNLVDQKKGVSTTEHSRDHQHGEETNIPPNANHEGISCVSLLSFSQGGHMSVMSNISMQSIRAHSPIESEVETHLQSALDALDPTTVGVREPRRPTILLDIPDSVAPTTFASKAPPAVEPDKLPLHQAQDPRRTTAAELNELTTDLKQMQSLGGSFLAPQEDAEKYGDTLLQNTASLVSRNQVSISQTANSDRAVGDHLRQRFHGTSKVNDSKLEDNDPSQVSTEFGATPYMPKNQKVTTKAKARCNEFEEWLKVRCAHSWTNGKVALFYVMIPATAAAAILFYVAGNPPCGEDTNGNDVCRPPLKTNSTAAEVFVSASASWWVLFIFVRQVITLFLASATMHFVVDYLAIRTKLFSWTLGPLATLFIVQSRGWCQTLFFWAAYDFALLYGRYPFANHWLYWQDLIHLMNAMNPSGDVLRSSQYASTLIVAVIVSFCVSVKRCWVGLTLGRHAYIRYSDDLALVMKKALLIAQVASLGRDIELSKVNLVECGLQVDTYYDDDDDDDDAADYGSGISGRESANDDDAAMGGILENVGLNDFNSSAPRRARVIELLGEWEEPGEQRKTENATIADMVQFRQSLTCLISSVPFSAAFGVATTRVDCVACAEALYNRLLISTPGASVLSFHVISLLAVEKSGNLDEQKVRELIRLFRPDREGNLGLLDFAKSVDSVYKELRLLRASVATSSKLDRSLESIVINPIFYTLVAFISLAALGMDPALLFSAITGFIIGFSFMIGTACSLYVQGLLLIFVRRPYDIGDRINLSICTVDTPNTGSPGWIVKDVDHFTTTVIYASTNEVATYSNGSLASFRIINAARSKQAVLMVTLKFPIDTPYERLTVYQAAIEKFFKARPREWLTFTAFRASIVEADLGYVEYIITAQHREPWQKMAALSASKAELSSFALELSKRLNMRYHAPPMPVELMVKDGKSLPEQIVQPLLDDASASVEYAAVAGLFGNKLSSP